MNNKNVYFFPIAKIATGGGLFKLNKPSTYWHKTLKNNTSNGGNHEI